MDVSGTDIRVANMLIIPKAELDSGKKSFLKILLVIRKKMSS
jgi:hypothetical protein